MSPGILSFLESSSSRLTSGPEMAKAPGRLREEGSCSDSDVPDLIDERRVVERFGFATEEVAVWLIDRGRFGAVEIEL